MDAVQLSRRDNFSVSELSNFAVNPMVELFESSHSKADMRGRPNSRSHEDLLAEQGSSIMDMFPSFKSSEEVLNLITDESLTPPMVYPTDGRGFGRLYTRELTMGSSEFLSQELINLPPKGCHSCSSISCYGCGDVESLDGCFDHPIESITNQQVYVPQALGPRAAFLGETVGRAASFDVCSVSEDAKDDIHRTLLKARRRNRSAGDLLKYNKKNKPYSKYSCPKCGKLFQRPSSLNTHMNIHTGDKPFVCLFDDCDKSFNARSNMLRHFKLHYKTSIGTYLLPNGVTIKTTPTMKQLIPSYVDPQDDDFEDDF